MRSLRTGRITVNDTELQARDGAAITDEAPSFRGRRMIGAWPIKKFGPMSHWARAGRHVVANPVKEMTMSVSDGSLGFLRLAMTNSPGLFLLC